MLINPAAAGLFDDQFRTFLNYKSQIAKALAGGVKGVGFSADYNRKEDNMGFGLSIFSNSMNRTALRDFNLLLSYGYRMQLNETNLVSFGVQSGFSQVGFSPGELTFGSQYDPTYTGGRNPNLIPSDLPSSNKTNMDASVGVYWKSFFEPALLVKTGISAFHLIPTRVDFLSKETYISPKFVYNAEGRYVIDPFHWIASVMYVSQRSSGDARPAQAYTELGVTAEIRDGRSFVSIGLFHRTPNVIMPTIGIGMDKFALNLSIEYFLRNSFSQIFNISLLYFPQITLPQLKEPTSYFEF
jgi:type IX secretion system PorP/SprF family membrane protein